MAIAQDSSRVENGLFVTDSDQSTSKDNSEESECFVALPSY